MHATLVPVSGPPPAPTRAPIRVVPRAVLGGAGIGAVYGIALRAWMRFVSDDPEFSWAGTLFIVGAFTIVSAFAGLVVGGRRRGWRALMIPARAVAIVLSLSCFFGAGALMFPTVVLGALALGRTDWPQRVRGALAIASALSVLTVVAEVSDRGLARDVAAVVMYVALVVVEIRIFTEMYRPTVRRVPTVCKVLLSLVAVVGALGVVTLTVGVTMGG